MTASASPRQATFAEAMPASATPRRALFAVALLAITIWAFWSSPSSETATEPGVRVDPGDAYNPVLAGERLPDGFRQLLPRDAIKPVYDPTFAPAAQITWPAATDVIGVELNGETKAYPVNFLTGRELVIDELGGIPILVSW